MGAEIADSQILERLERLESAVLADVMAAMGLNGQVVSSQLSALNPQCRMVGPAICATGREHAGDDALATFGLDESIYRGGIVVITTAENVAGYCEKGAIIGDNMATSMKNNGAIGFIVDGGVRDAEEFKDLQMPVYCQYKTPISAHQYWSFTAFETPVVLPGIIDDVCIEPGDWIVADVDGVVSLPKVHLQKIIEDAEVHAATENNIKRNLVSGGERRSVSSQFPRLVHVKPVK